MHTKHAGILVVGVVAFAGIIGILLPLLHTGTQGAVGAVQQRSVVLNPSTAPVFVAVWLKSSALSVGLCENALKRVKIENKFNCYSLPVPVTVKAGDKSLRKGNLRARENRPHANVACYSYGEESSEVRARITKSLVGKEDPTTSWTLKTIDDVSVPYCTIHP